MDKKKKTKKQHYVPRFYLSNWANEKGQIWVFDKSLKRSFQANIKDVASSNYFYDIPKEVLESVSDDQKEIISFLADKQIFEEMLSKIEEINSKIISKILSKTEKIMIFPMNVSTDNYLKISPQDKKELSFFLAIQYLRTKEARIQIEQLYTGTITALMQKTNYAPEIDFSKYDIALNQEYLQLFHLDILFSTDTIEKIATLLENYHWQILINQTKNTFYTSDSPVVYYPNVKRKNPFKSYGFASYGISVYFPLSPKYALLITEIDFFRQIEKQLYYKNVGFVGEDNVIFYNDLIVHHSTSQIYCNKNNFRWAKKRIEESPDLANINRKRVEIV